MPTSVSEQHLAMLFTFISTKNERADYKHDLTANTAYKLQQKSEDHNVGSKFKTADTQRRTRLRC